MISGLDFDECYSSLTDSGTDGTGELNLPCIFPFRYKGQEYYACTYDFSSGVGNKPWCSVKTDSRGNHIEGNWGVCDDENT